MTVFVEQCGDLHIDYFYDSNCGSFWYSYSLSYLAQCTSTSYYYSGTYISSYQYRCSAGWEVPLTKPSLLIR